MYEDMKPKMDFYVAAFFESLVVIKDDEENIYISPTEEPDLEIGDYIESEDKIPLNEFSEDFQRVVRNLLS